MTTKALKSFASVYQSYDRGGVATRNMVAAMRAKKRDGE